MKKLLNHPVTLSVLATLLAYYGKLVFATSRIHIATPIPPELTHGPVIFAFWHQQICQLPLLKRASPHPLLALMSASRDGAFMRRVGKYFNIGAVVGSSHRGAVSGARGLIQAARSGHNLSITPDGPRGPRHIAKQGATEIARLTKLPVIPCATWSARGYSFASWDGLRLPYPFTTITIAYGQPLGTLSTQALQDALNTLTAQAQGHTASLATPRTKS